MYEFWPWIFDDAGKPSLRVKESRYASVVKTQRAAKDDKKWVATDAQPKDIPIYFEATPDPVDHLDISIPTQLDGHEGEYFSFRVPGKLIDRAKWDGRKR